MICGYCNKNSTENHHGYGGKQYWHSSCVVKYNAESNSNRIVEKKNAALLYPNVYDKVDFTGGNFSEKRWLAAGGTQKQINKIYGSPYQGSAVFSINGTTGRGQHLNTTTKNYQRKSGIITPSKLHARIQKWFEDQFNAVSESNRIDSLIENRVAAEIKPVMSAGEFDKAFGKSWRTRVRFGYQPAIVGLVPIGKEELQQLKDAKIAYVCLDWTSKKIDFQNSWMTTSIRNKLS